MSDELKAAVERHSRRNQLGGFRRHSAYRELEFADLILLADAYIARLDADEAERADRAKPIDEAWLLSIGFRPFGGVFRIGDGSHGGYVDVTLRRGAMTANLVEWRHEPMPTIQSHGQLSDLLNAIGVLGYNKQAGQG